jgi:gamma-glutamyltranspeptidase / glutathione hydrolase
MKDLSALGSFHWVFKSFCYLSINYRTKMKNLPYFFLFFLGASVFSCRQTPVPPDYTIQKSVVEDSAMVVSPHPLATEVGVAIMRQGGNAVDAVVAVQFAIAVVYPRAGNIGGGGFMVYRGADGAIDALDYREKAPLAASRDMYLEADGSVSPTRSRKGHLAVGVPGTVAGLAAAHQKYGQLSWEQVIQPAIDLANSGYAITEGEANRLNGFQESFEEFHLPESPFLRDTFLIGHKLVQKNLARTLERIRDQGKDGFYQGETADYIVAEMERGDGLITREDLAQYEATWRDPVVQTYREQYRMISMPPSSSGGIALGQLLGIVEEYPLEEYGFHSTRAVHLMTEAERRVYADRAQHLGDSDFYDVPRDSLLDNTYLTMRMADFSTDIAGSSDSTEAGAFANLKESYETTHTSIVDPAGNAVSITTTLNSNFGSKVFVHGGGFFLNNEMDDFSAKPGVPNQFGLIGAEANAIQPGKRMLSSMTPTIFEKDGELFMVLGAPGGSTIITAVFQVFINVADFGMPLDQAVNAGRFHHQWLPDMLTVEKGELPESTLNELKALGHEIREVNRMAVIKAIQVLPDGRLHGAADPRNPDDDAKGY